MARKKIMIHGEHAAEKIDVSITPTMSRFLDAIALLHNTSRTDIARELLVAFIDTYRQRHADDPIVRRIESEVAQNAVAKLERK